MESIYIISKTFGARQLFLRRNGAQMIPRKVSAHIGVENFDGLGAIFIVYLRQESFAVSAHSS